jgi:glycosyltransferase involved in cell wall biosynthesis
MPSVFFISLMAGSPWGGSEELWFKTALFSQSRGWKVGCAVYHWSDKEKRMQPLKDGGAEIYYFPNKGRAKRNLLERIQNKISKQKIKKTIAALPVDKYDVVLVNMGAFENTTPAWRTFHRKLDRYIILYHNYKEHEVLKGKKKVAVQNWMSHAQRNLFASRRIMEVLKANSGIEVVNGDVLLNPISFPVPLNSTSYPPLEDGSYQLVMLAALESWRKAQDNLVKALSSDKWKQRNWNLHLYGDGKDKVKLQQLIEKNQLTGKVFLEGHVNEVKAVLQKAHLLLQVTHIDAMPLAVVEAMAIGRPVAVSDIGDMPDWVNEEENGWISRNASVEEIDATLEKAWGQRHRWAEMGESSFSLFQSKYPSSAEEKLLDEINASRKIK